MDPRDKKIAQQEKEIEKLNKAIEKIKSNVSVLARENNRRKAEINQIISSLRKG